MSNVRRSAVSYTRFSTPNQAKGDSESRQDHEYKTFCERHNLTPGKEVFADRGRSGYHGTHRTKGRLGVLVLAAKEGRFDPGTVIVIEAWDRLGRLRPDKQIELVSELLQTGVAIGVCRLNEIFELEDFGTHKWTTLSVFISLAFNESKQKAERLKSAWAARRNRARESGEKMLGTLPAWVERVDGELRLIPERASAVRRIYALALEGNGVTRIVRALTTEGVKPFGVSRINEHRTRSAFAGRWTQAYVAKILNDRRVMGDRQMFAEGKPDGKPLPGYFPPCVTGDMFNRVRAAQARKGRKSPRQRKYANVFKGLLVNASDRVPFNMVNVGSGQDAKLYLKNVASIGKTHTIPYAMFERCVLSRLRELRAADVLPLEDRPATTATTIRENLKTVRADVVGLKADLSRKYSQAISDVLRAKEEEETSLVNDLQDELARTMRPLSKAWSDATGVIATLDSAEDKDAMRIRIRTALAVIVETGTVLVAGTKSNRVILVQFDFIGGARRLWTIHYQPASGARPHPPEPGVWSGLPPMKAPPVAVALAEKARRAVRKLLVKSRGADSAIVRELDAIDLTGGMDLRRTDDAVIVAAMLERVDLSVIPT